MCFSFPYPYPAFPYPKSLHSCWVQREATMSGAAGGNRRTACPLFMTHSNLARVQPLRQGDVFVGQFDRGGSSVDGVFELRVHSPITGQAVWLNEALGAHPGWMTNCHQARISLDCAGAALERPVFGYLNYTGLGQCEGSNACAGAGPGDPQVQPSTGCHMYGCWASACGCNAASGAGCWGTDMREAIALVQRGMGVGEERVEECTFTRKIFNAEMAGARAVVVYNNLPYGTIYMAAGDNDANVTIPAVFVTRSANVIIPAVFVTAVFVTAVFDPPLCS